MKDSKRPLLATAAVIVALSVVGCSKGVSAKDKAESDKDLLKQQEQTVNLEAQNSGQAPPGQAGQPAASQNSAAP